MAEDYEADRRDRETAADLAAHAADKTAVLRQLVDGAAKRVTFVDVDFGGETHRLRLDVNAWCDVEEDAGPVAPIQTYRDITQGSVRAQTVRAIIRNGLRTGSPDLKSGPVVDTLMSDYPFSVAAGIAEIALAAWLVGAPPPKED